MNLIKNALVIIMSDSDSAFSGNNRDEDQIFQKLLSSNNAVLEPVILKNHHQTRTENCGKFIFHVDLQRKKLIKMFHHSSSPASRSVHAGMSTMAVGVLAS